MRDFDVSVIDGNIWADIVFAEQSGPGAPFTMRQMQASTLNQPIWTSGPFSMSQNVLANELVEQLETGDFDGDGDNDIMVLLNQGAPQYAVRCLRYLNNGNGAFTLTNITFIAGAGGSITDAVTGDFDGDGDAEVAFVVYGGNLVATVDDVLTGVQVAGDIGTVQRPLAVAAWDFDGNGTDEVVVKNESGLATSQALQIMNGNLTITQSVDGAGISSAGKGLAIEDLDQDGDADIAISAFVGFSFNVSIYFQDGTNGSFSSTMRQSLGSGPQADKLAVSDIYNDGRQSISGDLLNVPTLVQYEHQPNTFIRGDLNGSGGIDIGDFILLGQAVSGTGVPACLDTADVNDDGHISVADYIYLYNYMFQGGAAPSAPFPAAGIDPTQDSNTNSPNLDLGC